MFRIFQTPKNLEYLANTYLDVSYYIIEFFNIDINYTNSLIKNENYIYGILYDPITFKILNFQELRSCLTSRYDVVFKQISQQEEHLNESIFYFFVEIQKSFINNDDSIISDVKNHIIDYLKNTDLRYIIFIHSMLKHKRIDIEIIKMQLFFSSEEEIKLSEEKYILTAKI